MHSPESVPDISDLDQVFQSFTDDLEKIHALSELEDLRLLLLGKQGKISLMLKGLGALSPDIRRESGKRINDLRDKVQEALLNRKRDLEDKALAQSLVREKRDLSLPPPLRRKGSLHPTLRVMDEMIAFFSDLGFGVAEGPDIEDDFHNFTALNFPPKHPGARNA